MKTALLLPRLAILFAGLSLAAPMRGGSVSGRLLDSVGRPVAGARIAWYSYRDDDQILLDQTLGKDPSALGEIRSDAAGRFHLALEKPGQLVSVQVIAEGLPWARLTGPFDSSEETSLDDVQLPASRKVSGRVVDEGGKPVAGARVMAVGSEAVLENDSRFLSESRTQADGSFAMADAPDGARILLVRASGFVPVTRLQMEPRSEERIVLHRGGTIRGTIVDVAGKVAPGVIVITEDAAAESDGAGRYEITGVSPGSREVRALWKEDFAARRDNLRVKKGETVEAPLRLARMASIAGSVIEEGTHRPVAGARIGVTSSGAIWSGGMLGARRAERSARTDARGRFRLGGLAARPYLVQAARDGYLSSSLPHVAAGIATPGVAHLALRRAASVVGRVVNETGQAVPGARVRVVQEMGLRKMVLRGPRALAASMFGPGVVSGPDGSFRLKQLSPAANLALEATKTGYAPAHQPGVTLKPGDSVKGVSLVLRKGLEARGKIVNGQNEPIAGAEIRVGPREGNIRAARIQTRLMGMDRERPDAVSGADGSFLVKGLEEGEYTAVVARDGFARKSVPSLSVKAGDENQWPPIVMSPGIAISGFVRDTAGAAIAGAQILAIDLGAGHPLDASSGPDGRFRLDGVSADRPLMLNVTADGYAALQKSVTPPAEDLAIVLKSVGTIRGWVEDADTKRPVTDFTIGRTAPMSGFVVQFGRGGDRSFHSEDGSFEISDVPPGKWTVRATASGYRPAEISGVEVGEGETKEKLLLSMKRGGSLAGRVLDSRNTGVANASVSWEAVGSGGGGPIAGMLARFGGASNTGTTTDADGHFSFEGLPEGKLMITASHTDYLDVTRQVDPAKETSVDLVLGTGGSIAGTVVGQDGRTPVPGAQVSLDAEGDARFGFGGADSTRADGSGNFLFEHLQAGRYKVIAQSNTGKTTTREVVLGDGQRLDGVLLQMMTGTLIDGTVSGLPAGKLAGVRVSAGGNDYNDSAVTDDAGKFTLRDAPSGRLHFTAATSFLSGRSASTAVEIPEGAAQFPVEIVFQGTSRLSGRVTRGDRPLSGLFVIGNPLSPAASGGGRASTQTDESGQYALEGLNDGEYAVMLSGQGVSYRKNFTVSGDTPGDIVLPPVQIRGTVTEAGSGEPLDGVAVHAQLQPQSGQSGAASFAMKSSVTDSTGSYFVDDVDPGTYRVSAGKSGYVAKTQTLSVGAESASMDFGLSRGEGVSIRVADGLTGIPLKGVTVAALAGDGSVAYQGFVGLDSTGKGEISTLSPGRYAIHFFSDGYAPRTAVIGVPSPLVPLALTPGGRVEVVTSTALSGRLVDASGMPYLLSAYRTDGRVGGAPPVISWEHLAPGSYQLLVGPPGGERPYPFTVLEGQTTRIEVR